MKALILLLLATTACADMTFDKWQNDVRKSFKDQYGDSNNGSVTVPGKIDVVAGTVTSAGNAVCTPESCSGTISTTPGVLFCNSDGLCGYNDYLAKPKKKGYAMKCEVFAPYSRCENDEVVCYADSTSFSYHSGIQCIFK